MNLEEVYLLCCHSLRDAHFDLLYFKIPSTVTFKERALKVSSFA